MIIMYYIILILLLYIFKKDKSLFVIGVVVVALHFKIPFLENMSLPGFAKNFDIAFIFLFAAYLVNYKRRKLFFAPDYLKKIYYFWFTLFIINLLISLKYQDLFVAVKYYRYYLWLLLPFFISALIRTEKDYEKLKKYIIFTTFLSSLWFIYGSEIYTGHIIRLRGNQGILLHFGGLFALTDYIMNNRRISLLTYILSLFCVIISLARGWAIAFIMGSFLVFIISQIYFGKKIKIFRYFSIFIGIILLYYLLSGLNFIKPLEERFVKKTRIQMEREETLLSGRYFFFTKKSRWVQSQGEWSNFIGVGRIYPSESQSSITGYEDPIGTESTYFNMFLSFGYAGTLVFFAGYFFLIWKIFSVVRLKEKYELISTLSYLISATIHMVSSNIIDSVYGIIIISLSLFFTFNRPEIQEK